MDWHILFYFDWPQLTVIDHNWPYLMELPTKKSLLQIRLVADKNSCLVDLLHFLDPSGGLYKGVRGFIKGKQGPKHMKNIKKPISASGCLFPSFYLPTDWANNQLTNQPTEPWTEEQTWSLIEFVSGHLISLPQLIWLNFIQYKKLITNRLMDRQTQPLKGM